MVDPWSASNLSGLSSFFIEIVNENVLYIEWDELLLFSNNSHINIYIR